MAEEPDSTDRVVVFTISDGTNEGSAEMTLTVLPIDDSPTIPILNGTGIYDYTEGDVPTELTGISLVDEDSTNSIVEILNMTFEIENGGANEQLQLPSLTSNISVSHTLPLPTEIQSCVMS